tara:strand:- start:7205 stop:8239 length:1035 start_codon:yes stop_codon:yes gene_type:complete
MKKILFVTTQYRTGERIYPVLPWLCKNFSVDLFRSYQMDYSHKWVGDIDMRKIFDQKYINLFKKVYALSEFSSINVSDYDIILTDDNRSRNLLPEFYKNRKGIMIGCSHGNATVKHYNHNYGKAFDKCFVFGDKEKEDHTIPIGIPANDNLKKYRNIEKEHILIIVNFLGNRSHPFRVSFDKKLFFNCNLHHLQKYYKKKIILKLKSRADEGGYEKNLSYLNSIMPSDLDWSVTIDSKNDNELIAKSCCVISAPSTLTFKSIQLSIPTVVINDSGQIGLFNDFCGLVDINSVGQNRLKIFENLIMQESNSNLLNDFILKTIKGGSNFSSTKIMIKELEKISNEI